MNRRAAVNRRAFLSWVAKGGAGLAAVASLPEFVFDHAMALGEPAALAARGITLASFQDVTAFVGQAVSKRLSRATALVRVAQAARIGSIVEGVAIRHQFSVDADPCLDQSWTPEGLDAYADALARSITEHGLTVFAPLDLPRHVDGAANFSDGRVWLRGVSAYDVRADRMLMRFDVLGGTA